MVMWSRLPGITKPITVNRFVGVNKLDPFSIPEGAATSVKNMTASGFPAMKVRPGFSNIGASFGGAIVGLAAWKDTELHAVGGGNWKKWTGSAWSSALLSSISATLPWSFCNFQGNFAGINLLGVNSAIAKKYDGTNVTDITNCPSGATYIDAHDNRVYVSVGYRVTSSKLADAQDYDTTNEEDDGAWYGDIETPDGSNITGLKAGPQRLTVFKPYHTFELFGTGKLTYRLKPASDVVGCVANNSIMTLDGKMHWLSHRGIEKYAGGLAPDNKFAEPVQWYIDNINQTHRAKSCAGTDEQRYYLAIPVSAATEPSHVLEYDPQFGTWYVWELPHYPRAFTLFQKKWYEGDSVGQVHKLADGATSDNGTAISWEWISKPFGGGSYSQKMDWYDMWLVFDLPSGSTMNVYLSKLAEGDTDWTLVKSMTAGTDIQSARAIIPVASVANANWVRVKITGSGPCTINECDRKMRLLPYV